MRHTRSFRFPKRILVASALLGPVAGFAGLMRHDIDLQTYRDFAENRGQFAAGNTATIYDSAGNVTGTVVMPNFDSLIDGGHMTLAGSAQTLITVDHNGQWTGTFDGRFGGLRDTYHEIYSAQPGTYDFSIRRLDKVVTEAPVATLMTDTTQLNSLVGKTLVRAGSGTQEVAISGSTNSIGITGAYSYLTGGTLKYTSYSQGSAAGTTTYTGSYTFSEAATTPSASNPLAIGSKAGDSGSPTFAWNPVTGQYEIVAVNQSGGGPAGYGKFTNQTYDPTWYMTQVNSFNSPAVNTASTGTLTMSGAGATGAGTITQGATTWNYIGLAPSVHGATSTTSANGSTTAATDAQQAATRNLIFGGAGGTLNIAAAVDMGAGSMTFNSNYTLTGARLNTAGFIVNSGATLTTQLTGLAGDEWRKIGAGKMIVSGSGNNLADLNIGGAGIVELNRTGGYAAQDVTIAGGAAVVRLVGTNQIGGTLRFGHHGGTLDLYGNTWNTAAITATDYGATFSNTKANTTSTFTFTGSGAKTYLGGFTDSGSLANGLLNVVYNPTTPSGAVWTLNGVSDNKGTWTVSGGQVVLTGTPTLHAGGYVDPNDWQRASLNTGVVSVAGGANFTVGQHADFTSASVSVANGGTLAITGGNNTFSAAGITLNGTTAAFNVTTASGQSLTVGSAITGTGGMTSSGTGTLTLSGANTFTGTKTHTGGTLLGTSLAALGDTTTNKWNLTSASSVIGANGATAAQVKAKLTTGSVGTLALAGTNPDAAPDMTGYSGLYLGAIGAQSVGTAGTTSTLTAWNGTGWNLGGGGGALTMNLKLSGAGPLNVGNGYNTGTVVLTNANNNTTAGGAAFTGMINVNSGVALQYTDINALGSLSGADRIAVAYGARLALGTGANATSVFNAVTTGSAGVLAITGTDTNAYSFSGQGLNSAALGANGTATYSGTLTPGTGGYKFGGNGALTVTSVLSGANALSADGQGSAGGVTTLAGANTFTGAVTVQGGIVNGILGSHTLKLGSNTALGTGNAVTLNAGGAIDINGRTSTFGTLTGTASSSLINSSATASTLTINQSANSTMAGTISGIGAVNLVKSGTGVLTLSGANSQTGTVTINAGAIKLGSSTALGETTNAVTVASGAALDFAGNSAGNSALGNSFTISGSGNGTLGALHNSVAATTASLGTITLATNATISGAGTTAAFTPGTFNLAGNTLTVTNARLNTGDSRLTNGNITGGAGSLFYVSGTQSGAGSTGTWTLGVGSELMVRDYDNTAITAMKTIVLDGGKISNGNLDNGGGAQSTIDNNIVVNAGGTITANNVSFGKDLRFTGTLSGSGALTINGSRATEFQGNTSGYTGAIAVASGSKLAMNGTADQSLSGVISGAGALVKSGATMLTLTGNNTYTGTTTINAGVLQIGNGGTTGSLGTGAVTNNGALAFNRSNSVTIANTITGSGALTFTGTGVSGQSAYTLTGNNSGLSGAVTATNARAQADNSSGNRLGTGTLTTGTGGQFFLSGGTAANAMTLSGDGWQESAGLLGALRLSGGATASGAVTLVGDTRITAYSSTGTVSGAIGETGGARALEIGGAGQIPGIVTFTGTNTYSGTTTISSGTLRIGAGGTAGTLGSGAVVNNAALAFNRSDTISVGNTISGTGTLTQSGSGNTVLAGENTYSGTTAITAGTLTVGDGGTSGTLGTGAVANNAALIFNRTDTFTAANAISGTGTLTQNGPGMVVLTGNNTYSGVTRINGGRIRIGNGGTSGTLGTGAVVNDGTLSLNRSDALTVTNAITGTGAVSQIGAGTTTLTGANSYAGTTTINTGVLQIGDGGISGTLGTGDVVNNGTLAFNRSDALTVANTVSGAGTVSQIGTGTTTLTAANNHSGGTTVNSGTLVAANANALGAGSLAVNGGALDLGANAVTTGDLTLAGGTIQNGTLTAASYAMSSGTASASLAGTGALTQSGGTTTLSGNNTYTGGTTVNSGTLALGNAAALGASTNTLAVNGGTLDLGANAVTTGGLTLNGGTIQNGTLTSATFATNSGTVSAILAGSGALSQSGGTTTLSGNNTYTGGTTVNSGTLALGSGNALANAGTVTVNGGALDLGGYSETVDAVSLNGGTIQNGTLTGSSYTTASGTVSAALAGSGTLTQSGLGTTLLSGANSYSGRTTVNSGTLVITGTNSSFGATTVNAGTLALDAGSALASGTLSLNNGSKLTSSGTQDIVINNAILLQSGAVNTFNFGDTTNTGDVKLTAAFSLGGFEKKISVASGASAEFSGVISAANVSGRITKIGSGTLTLSGANTINGTTTVNGGTLIAGHNSAFGTGAVTVNNNGTLNSGTGRTLANAFTINTGGALGGAATFTGTVTINSGATLTPGSTGSIGMQSFGNGVTLAAGASYLWEISGLAPATAGVDFDQIVVTTGTMAIASSTTLKVSALGVDYTDAFWNSSHNFLIATKSGAGTITGAFDTLDTTNAGNTSGQGSWSLLSGANGLSALWTANSGFQEMSLQAVPEPSTYGLIGAGALALVAAIRRRKKSA